MLESKTTVLALTIKTWEHFVSLFRHNHLLQTWAYCARFKGQFHQSTLKDIYSPDRPSWLWNLFDLAVRLCIAFVNVTNIPPFNKETQSTKEVDE